MWVRVKGRIVRTVVKELGEREQHGWIDGLKYRQINKFKYKDYLKTFEYTRSFLFYYYVRKREREGERID